MIDRQARGTIGHGDQAAPGIPGEAPEEGGVGGRERVRLDEGDLRPASEPLLQPYWHGVWSAECDFPGLLGWGGNRIGDTRPWGTSGNQHNFVDEIGAPGSRRGEWMNPQKKLAQVRPL